jgi:hypothetical protein
VTSASNAEIVVEDDDDARMNMIAPGDETAGIDFGDPVDVSTGWLIYNNTDDRMRIGVNNSDRIVIDNTGEVGIGTSGPSAQLHAYKNTNGINEIKIENPNTGSSSAERLSFVDENGNLAFISAYDEGSGLYSDALVMANNRPNGNLRFYTDSAERLSIAHTGEATFGSATGWPLTCQIPDWGYIGIESDDSDPVGLRMSNSYRDWYLIHSIYGHDRLAIWDDDAYAERLSITGGMGYVGIHNPTPSRELDVSGRLRVQGDYTSASFVGEFKNTNSGGNALTGVGDGESGWYLSGGCGVTGIGFGTAAFFRANNSSSTGGQRAIYAYIATGDYTNICYRSLGGVQYDVNGTGGYGLTVPTSKGHKVLIAPQSPEAWIEDYGSAEIKDGFCHVDLDQLFTDCVTIDDANPLKVFVQMTSPVTNQYYVEKGTTGFDVIVVGDGADAVNGTFDYRVVAARKLREKVRFAEAASPEEIRARAVRMTPEQMDEDQGGSGDAGRSATGF